MDNNLQEYYKKLLEKRDNYKRYLKQAQKMYKKELKKHERIILYGSIISFIIFSYIQLRKEYNFYLMEIVFSKLFIEPLTIFLIFLLLCIVRSIVIIFIMTRKKTKFFHFRLRRGISDEIERLEDDLIKIELEIDEIKRTIDKDIT